MKFKQMALVGLTIMGTTMAGAETAARDDRAAEALGFKVGLQAWTFNMQTFYDAIDHARDLGLKYIEMYPGQTVKPGSGEKTGTGLSAAATAELKEKLKSAGVQLVSFGVAGIPTDESGARKHFNWARSLGLQVLVTETTPTPLLDKLSEEYGLRIALHNHPKTWPPDQVLAAVKDLSPRIGSGADTGHWLRAGKVPVDTLKLLEGRIIESHFKDLNEKNEDVPWGQGRADVKGMLAELKRQGFQGFLMIEFERGGLADKLAAIPPGVKFLDEAASELAR